MKLSILGKGDEHYEVVCLEHESVWRVKQKIAEQAHVMPHRMHLFGGRANSKELRNMKTLGKAGLRNGAQLTLTVAAVGSKEDLGTADPALVDTKACFAFGGGLHNAIAQYPSTFKVLFATPSGERVNPRALIDDGLVRPLCGGSCGLA